MVARHVARRMFATASGTVSPVSHAVSSATASTSETSTRAAARAATSTTTTAAAATSLIKNVTGFGKSSAPSSKSTVIPFDQLPAKYVYPEQRPLFNLLEERPQLAGLAVFGAFVVFCILASPSTSKRQPQKH